MSFGSSSKPKIVQQEKTEEITQVQEDSTKAAKREKRKQIIGSGQRSTVIAGLQNELKQRLGQ